MAVRPPIQVRKRTNPATRQRTQDKTRPAGVQRLHVGKHYDETMEDPHILVLKDFKEKQQLDDPFSALPAGTASDAFQIAPVPYNLASLVRLPMENNMLAQCVASMVTNVEGHGYRLEFTGDDSQKDIQEKNDLETSPKAKTEKTKIENLLDHPNDDHNLQELRERVRCDLEVMGNGYIEVGRDRNGKEIVMLAHIPGLTMRLTNKDRIPTKVKVELPRNGQLELITIKKRFRRFVQAVGAQKVYFKEFGDPRIIDPHTGLEDTTLNEEDSATEIIHLSLYTTSSVYGIPRWINQLPSVLGSRQSEMTNLDFFKENAIPAMALLVGGGAVTQASIDDTESHFLAARGRASMNRILVIEAEGDSDAAGNDGRVPPPKLELKMLQGERQSDALFQKYDAACMKKIRSSFRLPPIFVGQAEEYSHATALTSYEVAESQVFGPERKRVDDMINSKILKTLSVEFWTFRSNPPRLASPQMILEAITSLDNTGALTPNVTIGLANELFDLSIPPVGEAWGDLPMAVTEQMMENGVLTIDENGKVIITQRDPEPTNDVSGDQTADGDSTAGRLGKPGADKPKENFGDDAKDETSERLDKVVNLTRAVRSAAHLRDGDE